MTLVVLAVGIRQWLRTIRLWNMVGAIYATTIDNRRRPHMQHASRCQRVRLQCTGSGSYFSIVILPACNGIDGCHYVYPVWRVGSSSCWDSLSEIGWPPSRETGEPSSLRNTGASIETVVVFEERSPCCFLCQKGPIQTGV